MHMNLTAGACAIALVFASTAPAYAFDCAVAKKPTGAGSAGTYNFVTDDFTPSKPNAGDETHIHGGFITITDGTNSASNFVHAPQGVLPPVREGGPQDNCDGKGLESLEEC